MSISEYYKLQRLENSNFKILNTELNMNISMCQSICLIPAFDFNKQISQNSSTIQSKPCSVNQWGCLLRIAGAVDFWLFSSIILNFSVPITSVSYFSHTHGMMGEIEWLQVVTGEAGCGTEQCDCELSECSCDGYGRRRCSNRGVIGLVVCVMKLWLIQTDRDRAVWASARPSPLFSGCFLAGRNRHSLRLQCFLTVRKNPSLNLFMM